MSELYDPDDEAGILWNDPDIGIEWPIDRPLVNERDGQFPLFKDINRVSLPKIQNVKGCI